MQILVTGTAAFDTIETPFGTKENVLGGSAIHFSVAASFLSLVRIVADVGPDFSSAHLKYLEKKGVDTHGIRKSEQPTFAWKGKYEYDMAVAHTLETRLGALASFDPELTEAEKKTPFLFLANLDPDIQWKILSQMENPRYIGLDSMNFWLDQKKEKVWKVLKKADVLFLNDAEIRQLSGEASLIKAARLVQKKGPSIVLVKKGEHGVLAVGKDFTFITAAFPTETVKDPTGAGDSFAGGFFSYMADQVLNAQATVSEQLIRQAVVWGAAVASFNVENFSTKGLDKISREDIVSRCLDIHDFTRFERHG